MSNETEHGTTKPVSDVQKITLPNGFETVPENPQETTTNTLTEFGTQREETQTEYKTLLDKLSSHETTVKNKSRNGVRQGTPLSQDTIEAYHELTAVITECIEFLSEHEEFVKHDEETKLRNQILETVDTQHQITSKIQYDRELREIQNALKPVKQQLDRVTSKETAVKQTLSQTKFPAEKTTNDLREALLSPNTRTDVLNTVRKTRHRLNDVSDVVSLDELTNADKERVSDVEKTITELQTSIETHNTRVMRGVVDALTRNIEDTESRATQLKHEYTKVYTGNKQSFDGEVKPYVTELENRVHDIETIERITSEFEELTEINIDSVSSEKTRLKQMSVFIQSHVAFTETIVRTRTQLSRVKAQINELLQFDSYLTSDKETKLVEGVERIETQLTNNIEQIPYEEKITDDEWERVETLREEIQDVVNHVKSYNERFIEKKRGEYKPVFNQMGEDNLSLNPRQEKAVFSNDVHNQINAGAGTGKTFSVACRIKYLVDEGVRPSDILALTFLKDAAEEMETRLKELFGITGVETATLHSFGNKIIRKHTPSVISLEGEARIGEIAKLIQALSNESPEFNRHVTEFRTLYRENNYKDERNEKKKTVDMYDYSNGKLITGETVFSDHEEIQNAHNEIADWLFNHGVAYDYKQYADWAGTVNGDVYIPDFALSNSNIEIEYTPSHVVKRQLKSHEQKLGKAKVNSVYARTDRDVIFVTDKHVSQGVGTYLKSQLETKGVTIPEKISSEERLQGAYHEIVMERGVQEEFAEFIKKAKTNKVDLQQRIKSLDEHHDPEVYHFTLAATQLFYAYNKRYEEIGAYDFVDMIRQAGEVTQEGSMDSITSFRHVIVDEFQDLNLTQIEFVKAILSRRNDSRLFAVGDDWQSIYGFKAARPEYFIDFEEHFAPSTKSKLVTNYRCPESIVNAGNKLIEANTVKTEKEVVADKNTDSKPRVHNVTGSTRYQFAENVTLHVTNIVVNAIQNKGRAPNDILVLVRNERGTRIPNRIRFALQNKSVNVDDDGGVRVLTAHKTKGSEAKHVIIVNASDKATDGFPSEEREQNLTRMAELQTSEHIDEERRLFYVALTRAKNELDIIARASNPSRFLQDIEPYTKSCIVGIDTTKERTSFTASVSSEISNPPQSQKQVGSLADQYGYAVQFTIPIASSVQPLSDEHEYRIENASVEEYNEEKQIVLDSESTVSKLSS